MLKKIMLLMVLFVITALQAASNDDNRIRDLVTVSPPALDVLTTEQLEARVAEQYISLALKVAELQAEYPMLSTSEKFHALFFLLRRVKINDNLGGDRRDALLKYSQRLQGIDGSFRILENEFKQFLVTEQRQAQ